MTQVNLITPVMEENTSATAMKDMMIIPEEVAVILEEVAVIPEEVVVIPEEMQ